MKKEVLIVIESLACGGAEKSLISLLPLLDYDKYNLDLMIHNRVNGLFESMVDERVHILPPPEFCEFCKLSPLKEILSFRLQFLIPRVKWAMAIRKKENRERHASEVYWENCKDTFPVLKKEYDVAIAWGQGNSTHYVAEKVHANKKLAWINADYILGNHDKEFDYEFYKKFNKIVVVSNKLLPITKAVFPDLTDKMCVIYDIVNADIIKTMASAGSAFENDGGFKIVTVGRLEKPKGYDTAVEACRILKEKGYQFTWYVIGDGSERKQLEEKIEEYNLIENFKLLGAKSNPYTYMSKADAYVQTSVFEGYCLTLAEARLLNKPIVTTNFDVVYDQITDGVNGLIADMTPESVADDIARLIEDSDLREKIRNNLSKEKKGNEEEAVKFMKLLDE